MKFTRIAALDIGGTSIKYGIVERGKLLSTGEVDTNAKNGGESVIKKAEEILGGFRDIQCIGISTAGQVDPKAGTIVFANENIPRYTGMKIKERLEARFSVPVAVENDVNAAAVGEAQYGAGSDDFLMLTYGTGVGGAIVVNGKIYTGDSFSAGEFGHIVTHAGAGALSCNCGLHGCYERYASVSALVKKALKIDESLVNGKVIFERMREAAVKELVDDWLEEIVYGLASLVHIFNPALIVLGGGIMKEKYAIERLRERLIQSIMPSYAGVKLHQAELGNNAGLLGAAFLASQLV